MNKLIFTIVMLLCSAVFTVAQDNVDFGLWNDVQFTKPFNKTTDVMGGVRFDTKNNTQRFSEQRAYIGVNFKRGKQNRFTFMPGVVVLRNFSRAGAFFETRPQLITGYRFTANNINITPRVRLEYHAKHNLPNSGRVVPILHFDKKISKNYGVFNTNEFWVPIENDRDVAKYRKRIFAGVTRTVNPTLTMDVFYLYQRDEQIAPLNTHKIGVTWKFKL